MVHLEAGWLPQQELQTCRWRHRGNVQPTLFHFLHGSPEGFVAGRGGLIVWSCLPVRASTAVSIALRRSFIPGSGSPRWAHSSSVWVEAKHSSQRFVVEAMPVKHMVYRVELITDHLSLRVRAACRRKAASYRTQARPEKSWLTRTIVDM